MQQSTATAQRRRGGANTRVGATAPTRKYLTFEIGAETYGIDIRRIKEIIEYCAVTRVPMSPRHVRGVINLRGNVIPIIDLAVRFGREPGSTPGRRACSILVEADADGERMELGFVVDNVDQVLDLTEDQIRPAPPFGSSIRTDFVEAVGKAGAGFVTLLDVNQVFAVDELCQA